MVRVALSVTYAWAQLLLILWRSAAQIAGADWLRVVIAKARGPVSVLTGPSLRASFDQPRFGVIGTKRASLFGSSLLASLLRKTLSNRSTNISASMAVLLVVHATDGISWVSGTKVRG